MIHTITCDCQRRLQVRAEHVGQTVQCPGCGKVMVLSEQNLVATAAVPPSEVPSLPNAEASPSGPASAFPWGELPPVKPRAERHWLPLAGIVFLLLGLAAALACLVVWALVDGRPTEKRGAEGPPLGREIRVFRGHGGFVRGVAFSSHGRWALSGGGGSEQNPNEDCSVRLWDIDIGRERHCFRGHERPVVHVAFSPDDGRALSCGDRGVRIWDLQKRVESLCFKEHEALVECAVFSPDGRQVLSCDESAIRLWDADTGQPLRTLPIPNIYCLAFTPDGKRALAGGGAVRDVKQGESYPLRLLDLTTGQEIWSVAGHTHPIWSAGVFPDGQQVYSGGLDGLVRFWDLRTGLGLGEMRAGLFWRVALSPDGRRLLAGGEDHLVRLWDVGTGRERRRFVGHSDNVSSVAISPDGRRALSGSHDRTVRLWELGEDH